MPEAASSEEGRESKPLGSDKVIACRLDKPEEEWLYREEDAAPLLLPPPWPPPLLLLDDDTGESRVR